MAEFHLGDFLREKRQEDLDKNRRKAALHAQAYGATADQLSAYAGDPSQGMVQMQPSTFDSSAPEVDELPWLDQELEGIAREAARHDKDIHKLLDRTDALRDRLYEHEKATKEAVDALEALVDGAVHDAEGVRSLMCDIMNDAVNPLRRQMEALERKIEDPGSAFKIQYRYGRGQWSDYEPDSGDWMSVSSEGRGLIQMRMVRK